MTTTRRNVLAAGALALGAICAGCSATARRAARTADAPTRTSPDTAASSSTVPTPVRPSRQAQQSRGTAAQVAHGPRTRPEVALTFHGAGDLGIARELLAIFAVHRAKVTVLAVGTWLEEPGTRAVVREFVAADHELGNHTYRHLDINSMGEQAAREEIVRCRRLLVSAVGSPGAHFRQSQSRTASPLVRRLAGAAGYRQTLSYDVDSLDYTDPGPDAIVRNVAAAMPGSIVSMHFGHADTVAAMPQVLRGLAARGLSPVTVTTLLRP